MFGRVGRWRTAPVWAAPWGPSAALVAVQAHCRGAGVLVVGPPSEHPGRSTGPELSFPAGDSAGLAVAGAALRDRYGRLDGILFVPAAPPSAELLESDPAGPLADLGTVRAGLGERLPWVLVVPEPRSDRAGAAAARALEGAAQRLHRAASAEGVRSTVCLAPAALWSGGPLDGRAAVRMERALAGGLLAWALRRAAARVRR